MGFLCGLAAGVIKYLMWAANILFMLSGIAIVILGSIILNNFQEFDSLLKGSFNATAISIISIGSVIIVIGFCGCCGSIRKSVCLLNIYVVLLIIVFIAEIAIGIVALNKVGTTQDFMKNNFRTFFNDEYKLAPHESTMFDALHKKFECCAVDGPADFKSITGMTIPPVSCKCTTALIGDVNKCTQSGEYDKYYKRGCTDQFTVWLEDGVRSVGIVSLCVAACEVIAIVFACCLATRFKKQNGGN